MNFSHIWTPKCYTFVMRNEWNSHHENSCKFSVQAYQHYLFYLSGEHCTLISAGAPQMAVTSKRKDGVLSSLFLMYSCVKWMENARSYTEVEAVF